MSGTWGFKVRNLSDDETVKFLTGVLSKESCVPFIGTGFTAGENSRNGKVPNGAGWMQIMKDQINSSVNANKPSADELDKFSFQKLSDIFLITDCP